jgi:hypothetical protein
MTREPMRFFEHSYSFALHMLSTKLCARLGGTGVVGFEKGSQFDGFVSLEMLISPAWLRP